MSDQQDDGDRLGSLPDFQIRSGNGNGPVEGPPPPWTSWEERDAAIERWRPVAERNERWRRRTEFQARLRTVQQVSITMFCVVATVLGVWILVGLALLVQEATL